MATTTTTATAHEASARPARKDIDRFCQFLRRGRPGPRAHVVLLGLDLFDAPELLRAVKLGLPYRTFERFRANTSLPAERLLTLINLSRRTLTRRKRDGRLLPEESDRLLRASRVFGRALELFDGDRDAAAEWLTSVQPALGGAIPLDIASSELGSIEVERLIGRLEHGVFS